MIAIAMHPMLYRRWHAILLVIACGSSAGCIVTEQSSPSLAEPRAMQSTSASVGTGDDEHIDDSLLAESATEANKRLPMDMGNDTRLDKVSVGPGREMTFHATLTNRTTKEATPINVSAGRIALVKAACGSESVKSFLSDDIAVVYVYKTADGADFTTITVTDALCSK